MPLDVAELAYPLEEREAPSLHHRGRVSRKPANATKARGQSRKRCWRARVDERGGHESADERAPRRSGHGTSVARRSTLSGNVKPIFRAMEKPETNARRLSRVFARASPRWAVAARAMGVLPLSSEGVRVNPPTGDCSSPLEQAESTQAS